MDDIDNICLECNGRIEVGSWPFCNGDPAKHVKAEMHGFDEPLDYVDVQLLERKDPRCDSVNELGMRGVHIHSRSQRRALMREKELQFGSQKFEDRGKVKYFDQGKRS